MMRWMNVEYFKLLSQNLRAGTDSWEPTDADNQTDMSR